MNDSTPDRVPEALAEALADRYTLQRPLGAGGMATVYLATDLKHNRPVAVKVLRPELAAVVGAERFLSEIETTANLQHPHVLPLFDSGEVDGFLFYVMPYVEGESLRERLERERQLPVDQAVEITRKVASALQHAHERGVVHRDVKPANILLSEGEPLVADFGIALAVSAAGGGRVTETGLSLGTPHYMSPEQASGDRSLDPRSDVYALGCVCYEMLTGEPPFPGPTPQSVLAKILTSRAQRVTLARHTVPRHVDAAVARALEKLPADRFESVAAFRRALDDPEFRHVSAETMPAVEAGAVEPAGGSRRPLAVALTAAAVLAVAAAVGWLRPVPEAPFRRVPVRLEGAGSDYGPSLAVSPDGSVMAYVREGEGLALRRLASEQVELVAEGDLARTPFFSPDGSALGYHVGNPGNVSLRWISLSGGTAIQVTDDAYPGGTWSEDGFLYFADSDDESLWRARPEGAEPERLPHPEDVTFRWVRALPGGGRLLGLARGIGPGGGGGEASEEWRAVLIDTTDGEVRPITGPGIQGARLLDYAGGYLFWVDPSATLLAAPLDLRGAALRSAPAALATTVQSGRTGDAAQFDVGDDGTLVFYAGSAAEGTGTLGENLAWVDRDGRVEIIEERLAEEIGDFDDVALSPDGRYVAVQVQPSEEGSAHVWIFDLDQRAVYPLTFDGVNYDPEWLPGGRVAYVTEGDAGWEVRAQPFDRSGPEEVLLALDRPIEDLEVPPTGEPLVLVLPRDPENPASAGSVYLADPGDAASLRPFVDTRFEEGDPEVSPDGRWLAYVSDESGRREVVLRAFPDGGRPWPVSREGGQVPVWSPEGDELVFASSRSRLRSARLDFSAGVSVASLTDLFSDLPFELSGYELAPGAERFLMIAEAGGAAVGEPVMLFNVFGEIERRLAGG